MRLRHKKPLNPYKGQTNNDKSEFNDDDFNQQGSPIKRVQMSLIQIAPTTNDQAFKYARILTKFIKTVNQSYRLFAGNDEQIPNHSMQNYREQPLPYDSENLRENTPFKSQQINQRKQKLKSQTKKQVKQVKKQQKNQTKKKEVVHNQLTNQQNKPKPLDHSVVNSIEPSKGNSQPKNNIENTVKNERSNISTKINPPNSPTNGVNTQVTQNGGIGMHNIKTDANGGINPNNMQNNLQAYLNYASFFGQNQLLPGLYAGMQNGMQGLPMQMGQLPMGVMPGYMPNMLNMKLLNMGMQNPMQIPAQNQNQIKPVQNLFNEQVKVYSTNKDIKGKNGNAKHVYPLKRSAFHVAIAYKIYLDKLKSSGASFDNLDDIDPTRLSRRIKSGLSDGAKYKEGVKKKRI